MACPNIYTPEWQALEAAFGKFEAYRDFAQHNDTIRTVDQVREKLVMEKRLIEPVAVQPDFEDLDFAAQSTFGEVWSSNEITLTQSNVSTRRATVQMMNRLSESLGVEYKVVTPDEARMLTENRVNPYTSQKAFFLDGMVYLVGDNITEQTLFHEFSHPFVRALSAQNPNLLDNLYRSLQQTEEGRAIIEEATAETEGLPEWMTIEEAVVKALSKSWQDQHENKTPSGSFASWIEDMLFALRQMFRALFGITSSVENLDPASSFIDLARMLENGDRFRLDMEQFTQDDVVAYASSQKDMIDDMDKLPNPVIQDQINIFHEMISKQIKAMKANKDYKGLVEALSDEFDRGILQEIRANLGKYETLINSAADRVLEDSDNSRAHAAAFVDNLQRLHKALKHIKDEIDALAHNNEDTVENVARLTYFNNLLSYWGKFATEMENSLLENNVNPESPLFSLVSSIQTAIKSANKNAGLINEEGVLDTLWEQIEPMVKQVEARYKQLIEHATRTNQTWIKNKYQKEYKEISLVYQKDPDNSNAPVTPGTLPQGKTLSEIVKDTLRKTMKGQLGDAHFLNSFLEGYLYNQDPIISSFAAFVKSGVTEALQNAQGKYNDFARDMQPLLATLGYTPSNIGRLGSQVTFVDRVGGIEKVEGKQVFVTKMRHTFISPHKDYRFVMQMFDFEIEKAKRTYNEEQTPENHSKLRLLQQQKRIHLRTHYHQENVPAFYERERIFDDDLGQVAWSARQKLYDEMHALEISVQGEPDPEEAELNILDELAVIQSKIRQLHSLRDDDGILKERMDPNSTTVPYDVMRDLNVAEKLRTYREASNEFFEDVPRTGVFENALKKWEQKMLNDGFTKGAVGTPERVAWDKERQRWLDKNTRVRLKDSFYQERERILEVIGRITALMPKTQSADEDIALKWAEILDITSPNRDEDGQPVGTQVSENRVQKVKDLQQRIDEIKELQVSRSGLTKAEARLRSLLYKSKGQNSAADEQTLKDLNDKRKAFMANSPITPLMMDELDKAYEDLANLQSKEPTEYYILAVNRLLNADNRADLISNYGFSEFDENTAPMLVDDLKVHTMLSAKNPAFSDWYSRNHRDKEKWDESEKEYYTGKERLYVWNVIRPQDTDYYETTGVMQEDGSIEPVMGIPSRRYFMRKVKAEYKTWNQPYNGVGTTIDNQGNALPLLSEHGGIEGRQAVMIGDAPVEFEYINPEYYRIKRQEPALFAVLEKMKEHHLAAQSGLGRNSKLWMDIPRFRKQGLEIARAADKDTPKTVWGRLIDWIKSLWFRMKDDYDQGLNWQDDVTLVNADMWDEEDKGIPMQGLSDLSIDETSLDVTSSMMRYMLSGERHKVLRKMNPIAKALKNIVNSPESAIQEVGTANKSIWQRTGLLNPVTKKGKSVRAAAIDNLYEREFQGIRMKGWGSENKKVQAISSAIFGRASFAFFALNIPSALKNSMGAQFQTMLEAAGGEHVSPTSIHKGLAWATNMMAKTSMHVYNHGTKPLEIQIGEIFDVAQGRFEEKFGEGMSRTIFKDAVSTGPLYNFRKWSELHAAHTLHGAMLYTQLVEQTINGTTRKIPYADAWELVDGQVTLKKGIDPEWSNKRVAHTVVAGDTEDSIAAQYGLTVDQLRSRNKTIDLAEGKTVNIGTSKEFKAFRNRGHQVSNSLNGAYAGFDQPEASRYLAFRAVSFMKRYFTPMLMSRWAFRGKAWAPQARHDIALGDTSEGYYITAIQAMLQMVGSKFKYLPALKSREARALQKVTLEMGLLAAINMIVLPLIFGWDDDDEERYAKLRERSGALPGLFTHEQDEEWNLGGWISNHALSLAMNIRAENESFVPLPGFGLDDYKRSLDTKSIAMSPTVNMWLTMVNDISMLLDDKGYYQREVGPYTWQDEDGSKFINHMMKSIGVTGSTTSPVMAIKNFQGAKNRD
jgi:hypothetical protein